MLELEHPKTRYVQGRWEVWALSSSTDGLLLYPVTLCSILHVVFETDAPPTHT